MKRQLDRSSPTLESLARRLGATVKKPIAFAPETGRFYTAEDYAREQAVVDERHLRWLLDLGQRETEAAGPQDMDAMLPSFVGLYAETEPDASAKELQKLAREVVGNIRSFVVQHAAWEIPAGSARRVLEWFGDHWAVSFKTPDWRAAFHLRAFDLVTFYAEEIRECRGKDCGRLFITPDNRQIFCSARCARRAAYENFVLRGKKESG